MIGKVLTGLSSKTLGELTNPASPEEIISGKEAYDNDGNKITGTLEALNNPWKPSTESDYNAIVASKNKVGNYIEYSGKTTKVMPEVFSGVFDIGDTVTDVWFDTSITPSTPSFTEWDVTGISYNSKYYRVKYLMAGDGTWTFGDATLKQGIMIIANESDAYAWSIYYGYPYGEDTFIYSNSASDFLIKGWIFDYNTELETKVTFDSGLVLTTLLSSGYSWNGYFAFKNKTEQYGQQYYPLPTLTNEGTAADLAKGKQLINSQGAIVTGTKSDTPVAATGDYFVKVIDYDGTVLLDTRGNNGDSFDLPTAPSHEGLVFQEWSASCPIVDGKVIIDNNNIMAGAVYTTASGQNEFDITLTKATGLSVNLKLNQATTWENNVWDRTQTHTFSEYGNYTITNNGTAITTIPGGIFGQTTSNNNFFAKKARISNRISSITGEAFKSCCSLRYITLSNNITSIASDSFSLCYNLNTVILPTNVSSIANGAFNGCRALENIVLPKNITDIPSSCFMSCYKMADIALPSGITIINNYAFNGCANIKEIVFPADITTIGTSVFSNCYAITKYDFSQCSTIPTLGGTNSFTNINKICKIIVPDSLYDEWIAASNWSTYANYIYKASEVAE